MKRFPFLSLPAAVVLLRVLVALIFMAHAVVRIANGTIPRFAGFLEGKGLPFGTLIVWLITAYEIAGGILLAAGRFIRILSAGFILLLLIGIVLIHAAQGWFVGEHGTGGCEYSVALIGALIVIAAGASPAKQ